MPIRRTKRSKSLAGVGEIKLRQKMSPRYTMMDDIKKSELYGKGPGRDQVARDFIESHAAELQPERIVPGQLLLFEYFEPKNKEELEYYDASPCTIFFNIVDTSEGKRVLGFNIHYYPPKMRYMIMDRIFDIFKPIYSKYFIRVKDDDVTGFDYHFLIEELDKAGLGFGVRMYIPSLMNKTRVIPTNMWKVAVFTEGWFKKVTRTAIFNFWKQWAHTHKTPGKRYKRRNRKKNKPKTT